MEERSRPAPAPHARLLPLPPRTQGRRAGTCVSAVPLGTTSGLKPFSLPSGDESPDPRKRFYTGESPDTEEVLLTWCEPCGLRSPLCPRLELSCSRDLWAPGSEHTEACPVEVVTLVAVVAPVARGWSGGLRCPSPAQVVAPVAVVEAPRGPEVGRQRLEGRGGS